MKNAVWVLVVLSGLFTACQTGKPYSGPATWGKYASPAEAQKTVSGTMEPETEAAEVSAAIELQKKEEPAYYAP